MRAAVRDLDHLLFGAEMQAACRTSLDAGRFKPLTYAIGTERALENLLRLLIELRNIERTARDAVTTTNAVLLLKIDYAIFVFNDRTVSGTRAQASRILAMHALVLTHQPHQIPITLVFGEFDEVPVVPLGGRHRLIRVVESGLAKWMIVPLDAGYLARLATDTRRHVDVFADLDRALCTASGHGTRMRRDLLDLHCLRTVHHALSIFTRNPLYSGV